MLPQIRFDAFRMGFVLSLFCLTWGACAATNPREDGRSSLVYPGADGTLIYESYANRGQSITDNYMIDFSHAGYGGGGVAIPWVPTMAVLEPMGGKRDDHARIQAAIDAVSARPLSADGFRGAVFLRSGRYHVSRSLQIEADGVVIRGEGQDASGTVIQFTANAQDDLFEFSGRSGWVKIAGTETPIADARVPSGSRSLELESDAGFKVGDRIILQRTPNQTWIDLLEMGRYGWKGDSYKSESPRTITAIDGAVIHMDAPLVHAIESRSGGGTVYRYQFDGALRQVGIEQIRLESSYDGPTDEDHGWSAVTFRKAENAWSRGVTTKYFGFSSVAVLGGCQFVTVEDCASLDPKSKIVGSRRYAFYIDDASFVLMQRCYAEAGRHDFITGSQTVGPNVFVDSLAENTHNDIGPHHRYAEGILFDNIRGGEINVQNRRETGTGHGWAGAQVVFWNCHGSEIICDAPPGAMNFAIGCVGEQKQGKKPPDEPDGIWESRGAPVTPRSLYYAQLADRLGPEAVERVSRPSQREGTVWQELSDWRGASTDLNSDPPGNAQLSSANQ